MNYKVSLILPVYNVEKYLRQCIDSIISQSYENKEIILVDDGSKDNSPKICDEYSEKFDYIKVIHKENGGLSSARNEGIKYATGDYIIFVDSDDFIENNSLVRIMENINKNPVDVAFLEAQKVFTDGKTQPLGDGFLREFVKGKSKEEVLKYLATLPKYPAAAWSKIIKKDLFYSGRDMFFKEGLVSEDLDWCFNLILNAKTFDCYNFTYYNYRQGRKDSITNTIKLKNLADLMYTFNKWQNEAEKLNDTEKKFVLYELAYEYPIILSVYAKVKDKDKKKYYKDLKNGVKFLKLRKEKKYKLIELFITLFGIKFTGKLLNLYLNVR